MVVNVPSATNIPGSAGDRAAAIELAGAPGRCERGQGLAQRHARTRQVHPHQGVGRGQVGGALELARRGVPALGPLGVQAGLAVRLGTDGAGVGTRR